MRRTWPVLPLLLVTVAPSPVFGQAISGFASVPWGASRADVEAEWGRPTHVEEEGSVTTLRYSAQDFAGPKPIRGWSMTFRIRDDQLLSGHYAGLFEREPIAQEARRRMVEEVNSRYSLDLPRQCPKPYSEARSCALFVNSALGGPAMEQLSGGWRTVMIWITQRSGEWALLTEYMTAAEWAAFNSDEGRPY